MPHAKRSYGPVQILEERLYLTNLPTGRLDGAKALRVVRGHWRIENELHGTLDLQWQEDATLWVRRGNGLPVCALLRALGSDGSHARRLACAMRRGS